MTDATNDRPRDHESLKALAKKLGRPLYTLHVQDAHTDPFLAGQPARLRDAQWFADVWNAVGGVRGFHLRRLHYRAMSQNPPLLMPDGTPYVNTTRCVTALYDGGRDARHLGLIDVDDLIDRKNPEPTIYFKEGESAEVALEGGLGDLVEPTLEIPRLVLFPPTIAQSYLVEIWCEKSTMNDILMPLGARYGVNVITGTGELSLTHCVRLVRRAEETGLPVRILYISDFDPAGASMPVAVARKIEHTLYREQTYDPDIQVRPIVLTHDQCIEYRLPRSPIKESEARAGAFEARFGEGATELDALEALHPGELERILIKEIERYYDTTLADEVDDRADDIQSELDEITASVHEAHAEDLAKLESDRKAVIAAIKSFQRKAAPILRNIEKDLREVAPDNDQYDWPEPADGDEDDDPMFDSTRSYLDQIERYKEHQDKPTEAAERKRLDQYTCTCERCGKSFESARPKARACGPSCRTALWRKGRGI
jgi:hypothetical protein